MTRSNSIPSDGRIVDTMIQLARAAKLHRMIVAGSNSPEVFLELHRRGHLRATTAKLCDVPCGQFDVALVAWREPSTKALETTLAHLVPFLSGAGVLVVWARRKAGRNAYEFPMTSAARSSRISMPLRPRL
jgi:hypothetical protein